MMLRAISLAVAVSSGAAIAGPSPLGPTLVTTNMAVGVVALPDPGSGSTRIVLINSPQGGQVIGGSPQRSINMSCPSAVACFGQAATSGAFTNAPFASASASTSLNGTLPDWVTLPANGAYVAGYAENIMQYKLSVSGPANTTVYVHLASYIQIAGSGAGSGLSLNAGAGFTVSDSGGSAWIQTISYANLSLYRLTRDLQGNATAGYQPAPASGIWIENELFPMTANAVYTVSMIASASALAQVHDGGNASGGQVSAFVDPQFIIDPSTLNAAAYSILLSDGVGNAAPVPEPSTPMLWAAGILFCASRRIRRRICH